MEVAIIPGLFVAIFVGIAALILFTPYEKKWCAPPHSYDWAGRAVLLGGGSVQGERECRVSPFSEETVVESTINSGGYHGSCSYPGSLRRHLRRDRGYDFVVAIWQM